MVLEEIENKLDLEIEEEKLMTTIKRCDICNIDFEDNPDNPENDYHFCPYCGYRLTFLRR